MFNAEKYTFVKQENMFTKGSQNFMNVRQGKIREYIRECIICVNIV